MLLQTIAEKTRYLATSTHAEVMAYVQALKDLQSPLLHVTSFGVTEGGRELPLLVLSSEGVKDAGSASQKGLPVVLIQNCIHAGEVEGKEAALMLVRDLLVGKHPGILEKMRLLVVPIFNADGNDAMNTSNRALEIEKLKGQDGPPLVGTRVNASGINLNRDYIRHSALEMRLLQTNVCHVWEPDLTIDTHATNGSVHRFAMTCDIPHTVESGRGEAIAFMRNEFVPEVMANVKRTVGLDSGWYGNFVEDERALDSDAAVDPASSIGEGWLTYPHHPRFGSNYRGLTGRLDLLLECYSYLSFEERVQTTYAWLLQSLATAAGRADQIRHMVQMCRTPREQIAIGYRIERMESPIEILTRTPRVRDGAPHTVRIPYFSRFVGTKVVSRPRGYIVPRELSGFLRGHGLRIETAPKRAFLTFRGLLEQAR